MAKKYSIKIVIASFVLGALVFCSINAFAATYNSIANISEKYITYSYLASVIGLSANKIVSGTVNY